MLQSEGQKLTTNAVIGQEMKIECFRANCVAES